MTRLPLVGLLLAPALVLRRFGIGSREVAIAGKRVALITRFRTGNSQQTRERLYTGKLVFVPMAKLLADVAAG